MSENHNSIEDPGESMDLGDAKLSDETEETGVDLSDTTAPKETDAVDLPRETREEGALVVNGKEPVEEAAAMELDMSDEELEERLLKAGYMLDDPPSSVEDLLLILDKVEKCLAKVEQSPPEILQHAVHPALKALGADKLINHPDDDVKVAVASCISEITRITAPEAPYDDDGMKAIFTLIVSTFENLFDDCNRSFKRRTLILETLAKVRSSVVMLDLELDSLIIEMFQHFTKSIRGFHTSNVFSSMVSIMNLVFEESEDITLEFVSPLLEAVKKDNKEVLPIAQILAETVLAESAEFIRPCLIDAVRSLGISLDDYSDVVACIYEGKPFDKLQNIVTSEHATDESHSVRDNEDEPKEVCGANAKDEASSEQANVSNDAPVESEVSIDAAQNGDGDFLNRHEDDNQVDSLATDTLASVEPDNPDTEKQDDGNPVNKQEDGSLVNKQEGVNPADNLETADASGSLEPDNTSAEQNEVRLADKLDTIDNSCNMEPDEATIEKQEHVPLADQAITTDTPGDAEHDNTPGDAEPDNTPGEAEPDNTPGEAEPDNTPGDAEPDNTLSDAQPDNTLSDAEPDNTLSDGSVVNKGPCDSIQVFNTAETVNDSSPEKVKKVSHDGDKEDEQLSDNKESGKDSPTATCKDPSDEAPIATKTGEDVDAQLSSPVNEGSADSASPSSDTLLNQLRSIKAQKPKGKDSSSEEDTVSDDVYKGSDEGTNDLEAKPSEHSAKEVTSGSSSEDDTPTSLDDKGGDDILSNPEEKLLKQSGKKADANINDVGESSKQIADQKSRSQVKAISKKDASKTPAEDADKKKDEDNLVVETPKTSKRKRSSGKDQLSQISGSASEVKVYGKNLVGAEIKVMWPIDKKYYNGIIRSYNAHKRKHLILYTDGDKETLNLRKEQWEFINRDNKEPEKGKGADQENSDTSSDMPLDKKVKTSADQSAKDKNMDKPAKKTEGAPSNSKAASKKSGKDGKGAIIKSKNETVERSKDQSGKTGNESDNDDVVALVSGKSKEDGSGTSMKSKKGTIKAVKIKEGLLKTPSSAKGKSGSEARDDGDDDLAPESVEVIESEDEKETGDLAKVSKTAKGKSPGSSKRPKSKGKSGVTGTPKSKDADAAAKSVENSKGKLPMASKAPRSKTKSSAGESGKKKPGPLKIKEDEEVSIDLAKILENSKPKSLGSSKAQRSKVRSRPKFSPVDIKESEDGKNSTDLAISPVTDARKTTEAKETDGEEDADLALDTSKAKSPKGQKTKGKSRASAAITEKPNSGLFEVKENKDEEDSAADLAMEDPKLELPKTQKNKRKARDIDTETTDVKNSEDEEDVTTPKSKAQGTSSKAQKNNSSRSGRKRKR